jgi:FkbM family methyltransferase
MRKDGELQLSTSLEKWLLRFDLHPIGIIHAGAHLVQERDVYKRLQLEPVLWVEANPQITKQAEKILESYPKQHIVNAALWNVAGEKKEFSIAGNEGSSSSLLELGLITASHPEVFLEGKFQIETSTLKDVLLDSPEIYQSADFLLLDTQGSEYQVIQGLGESINQLKYILTEVSTKQLYRGTRLFNELTQMLQELKFDLVASQVNVTTGWGDALYIRRDVIEANGICTSDTDHIKSNLGRALGTFMRSWLIKIGTPNRLVSFFKRRTIKSKN